jgi:hypothetical protein
MVFTGPISRTVDLAPQGLFEKVFCPFVMHSQIWPFCGEVRLANGGDGSSACVAATGVSNDAGCGAGSVTVWTGAAGSEAAIACNGADKLRAAVL